MPTQYRCKDNHRRSLVKAAGRLNGIDYLEVLDQAAPPGSPRQRTLLLHCFLDLPVLSESNVLIQGGVRITDPRVLWVAKAIDLVTGGDDWPVIPGEGAFFVPNAEAGKVLVIRTDSAGDYSLYRLRLCHDQISSQPPDGFDTQLSEVEFSFKVECPSDFDCRQTQRSAVSGQRLAVSIDYQAKDYSSFRQLMLDRLNLIMPGWQERHAADQTIALVETLAYAADHLSYYQDAVATEAYLDTARHRISVRRHARLLDYVVHDGCNARVWVALEVDADAEGQVLPGCDLEKRVAGTMLLTRTSQPEGALDSDKVAAAISEGAQVFETMHDLTLHHANNELRFHAWGNTLCCLPAGSTRAALRRRNRIGLVALQPGDVLVFEEWRSGETGQHADADPGHRHAVRLTNVTETTDPVFREPDYGSGDPLYKDPVLPPPDGDQLKLWEIEWAPVDALPFDLCLKEVTSEDKSSQPVSIAWGNVVLADHGRTMTKTNLHVPGTTVQVPGSLRGPLSLEDGPVTRRATFDVGAPANAARQTDVRSSQPSIWLAQSDDPGITWQPQPDLLGSDASAYEFVLESEDDGTSYVRFGDGVMGQRPDPGTSLSATYRVGNGRAGNVGAESIANVVTELPGITSVRNPMPAAGGVEPEPLERVRQDAPQAFRIQQRAVTEADYAEVTARHPEVQKAVATLRWTGSWYTMFVTVDRRGGRPVDSEFKDDVRSFLEQFRLAGYDLEVTSPIFVPLDIAMTVCVLPGYIASDVENALLEIFSSGNLPDGRPGFFHPDNFTFAQPVYLSRVIDAAMKVPGVRWVDVDDAPPKRNRFQRWGQVPRGEIADGFVDIGRLEIARLDNDPNARENGKIEFFMEGGV